MSGSGRWWWYTSNMRWPELDLSPPWTVLRWPAVDLSYWWVNFSVVDDVLWGFVTAEFRVCGVKIWKWEGMDHTLSDHIFD
ncbi:hypothetical protein Ahy_Scaffold6g108056 [Arachis hypogaea]|uniref:Uncharacterized protein n=1 Tax=Arachis hypogaea TaxID=3818 RepID=A0A444WPT6_ARAHY|nr:hypothetical protein Ahy_Scaffold6g108056 [Arachis hypogaea]